MAMVKKRGKSAGAPIPSSVSLDPDRAVEPLRRSVYALDDLLNGITAENQQELIDFGKPVGKEVW